MNWSKRILNFLGIEKDLISIASGNTFSTIISGIFWLALASIMTVEDYGNLNYILSIATIATIISLLGMPITIKTYLPKGEEVLHKQASLLVLIANTIIVIPLFFLTNNVYVVILFLGMSFFRMYIAEVLGRRTPKKFFFLKIGQAALVIPLSISLFYIMGVNGIILGYALSTLALSYGFFKHFKEIKFQFTNIRKKIRFVINSYFIHLTEEGSRHLDKLMIAPLFGLELLGLYQIGFHFLMLLTILPLSISQFLQPQEAAGIRGKKIVTSGIIISVVFAAAAYFLLPIVITNLFPNFVDAIQAAQITIFSIIPMTFNTILSSKFLGREYSKQTLIGFAVRLSVFLVLLAVLGDSLGLIGLSLAIVISYIIQTIILVIMYRSLYNKISNW